MKKKLRIGFLGTPDFAVASLEALLEKGYDVSVVVTAPDRPAGRGRKLTASPVKQIALKHQIPVLQPERLKDPEFLSELAGFKVNLLIVVAFRMLPKEVWGLPTYGTFNLHASLLPDYRGAAPINWAIIRGETTTGVTTFFIDEQIDTGNILLQASTEIGDAETAGELHDRLMKTGASLVVETVEMIAAGPVNTTRQKHIASVKNAPKLNSENSRISWDQSDLVVYNKIRGLSPYPGAWTQLENDSDNLRIKIFSAAFADIQVTGVPGQLKVSGQHLFVCTGKGWLELLEIQLPGKRRMTVREVLNGMNFSENACFRSTPIE